MLYSSSKLPLLTLALKYLLFNHTTRADTKEAKRPNANRSVLSLPE